MPYLLSEHPGGGEGYAFLLSAISFQLVNGWREGAGSLRRCGIRRQGIFCGMHVYILRALCVIQCNWWATKLRLGRTCAKGVNPDSGKYRKMTPDFGCRMRTQSLLKCLRPKGPRLKPLPFFALY